MARAHYSFVGGPLNLKCEDKSLAHRLSWEGKKEAGAR